MNSFNPFGGQGGGGGGNFWEQMMKRQQGAQGGAAPPRGNFAQQLGARGASQPAPGGNFAQRIAGRAPLGSAGAMAKPAGMQGMAPRPQMFGQPMGGGARPGGGMGGAIGGIAGGGGPRPPGGAMGAAGGIAGGQAPPPRQMAMRPGASPMGGIGQSMAGLGTLSDEASKQEITRLTNERDRFEAMANGMPQSREERDAERRKHMGQSMIMQGLGSLGGRR